ncbi:MAG: hypothetical protein Q4B73_00330 [Lachnospiraceae bacterium]|nr:hypothetical protein [Lachnospiraceae bacterium]
MIRDQFIKPQMALRLTLALTGMVLMGLAIAILRIPVFGTDPYSAMMLGLANLVGMSYGNFCAIGNVTMFAAELLWGRRYIGIATFTNWFLLGYCVDGFCRAFRQLGLDHCPASLGLRVVIALVGLLIFGFALSMYQMADVGSSPYECLPLIIKEKLHLPFFISRVIVDGLCTLVAFLADGVIGVVTLLIFFLLGPIAAFFNRHVFARIISNETLL